MHHAPREWQILDVGSIWMKEFASAFCTLTPAVAWQPVMLKLGALQTWERHTQLKNPLLDVTYYPLQRGYARTPLRQVLRFEDSLIKRLEKRCRDPRQCALICTTPFYAPVAEKWPGPVIYYVTDLTFAYDGIDAAQVRELDERMCRVAHAVCPNSERIAEYLIGTAGCRPSRITIVPNATRMSNLAPGPLRRPGPLPHDIASLPRPIVGVIGNLAANLDWELLADAVERTPGVSWVFVGPVNMRISQPAQSEARAWLMTRACFVGSKPYGDLQKYARCFDVAVLPYRRKEPTYSGSSTRFYEHLAACRPILATRAFAELLTKEPLLKLVDTAAELTAALSELEALHFEDGFETARWQASRQGTWEQRARTILTLGHLETGNNQGAALNARDLQAVSF